ncbi:MAG: CPCC family cysteine-rich protein [Alphaproteobacteria bacterium]|nr:CPCC family cysteine-rich protein [Alphaproteobacteria bacterium]
MSSLLERTDAISLLCEADLRDLTKEERSKRLEAMYCEDWEDAPDWADLPADVRAEFESEDLEWRELPNASDRRYDAVLLVWLRWGYRGARNEYLAGLLRKHGHDFGRIAGNPTRLFSCPCCGLCTLEEIDDYSICSVCFWQDDLHDNHNAYARSCCNLGLSLIQARVNYLTTGICDPSRESRRALQEPTEKYVRGRRFILCLTGSSVSVREPATQWRATLRDDQNEV